jgi:hypothetical protein
VIKKQNSGVLAQYTSHILQMAHNMPKVATPLMDLVIKR